jgi:hypothetical protein
LSKPGALVLLIFFLVFLIFAGIFAITQESADMNAREVNIRNRIARDESVLDDSLPFDSEEYAGEPLPEWIPPGPPRWFRSNAGGMTLEEIPSRLAALRNKYALVIDYLPPYELEPRLLPFFHDDYIIEIRVLYEQGNESRRQWLFRSDSGNVWLNAVFRQESEAAVEETIDALAVFDDDTDKIPDDLLPEEEIPASIAVDESEYASGFIETFNENGRIVGAYTLFKDGGEILTEYFYNGNVLIKTTTQTKVPDAETVHTVYTDTYRYNRSFSLRHVERLYHGQADVEPVRLLFPSRILEAAANDSFLSEKLTLSSDFLGSQTADEGFRVIFDTDSRGRILSQTMFDANDNEVWSIVNTWSGDRIASIMKIEGDDNKLTEYEYNSNGDRIVQRDIHNGVLERLVYTDGQNETEELFLNGVVVLRAYWENGRKTHEERVRH